ncbi:LysR family transcriptional regulator [Nocardia jiangxiensis]|uniref:LysR family transcriptional regulator n=1 Tax=Nocardia jiangxiensis TaxID=282685 RepID=A0ABW6SBP5_9NOCA|nr:LysR family transcriptional regulator [Nocardia jiangxiensis]
MELRDIEIFLTLAKELHFGRTAERLRITPARVSQSIKKQERRIGGPLFDRTTRAVRLTPVGEQLHRELDAGYRQIVDGIEAASVAVRGTTGTLTLGCMGPYPFGRASLVDAIELFQSRHPKARMQYREIQPSAPLDSLRCGEVDVALVWLPVHEPDLTVGPVTHISRVWLMVDANHPFAQRVSVCLEDLGDCTVVAGSSIPRYMEQALNPYHTPSGRPIARGPVMSTWQQVLYTVASGRCVAGVVEEVADHYPWPSLAFIPVRDAPPCRFALIWRTAAETPLIRAFARTVSPAGATHGDPGAPVRP